MSGSVLFILQLCVVAVGAQQTGKSSHVALATFLRQPDVVATAPAGADPAAVSTLLRGSQALAAESSVKSAKHAKECERCFYENAQCGCEPAMEYLACVAKHCYPSGQTKFAKMCSVVQSQCSAELTIDCRGSETTCVGNFNQLLIGGLGLTWDQNAEFDQAFCGPFGNCIGEIHMHVDVHKGQWHGGGQLSHGMGSKTKIVAASKDLTPCQKQQQKRGRGSDQPAPCEPIALKVESQADESPIWLECGLPLTATPDINHPEDWILCTNTVQDNAGSCNIQMLPKLPVQQEIQAYCVLTAGEGGKRLTQPLWRNVRNNLQTVASGSSLDRTEGSTSRMKDSAGLPETVEAAEDAFQRGRNAGKKAIDAGGNRIDARRARDIEGIKDSGKPPYMKDVDALGKKRRPLPGSGIAQDMRELDRAAQEEGARGAAAIRNQQAAMSNRTGQIARDAKRRSREAGERADEKLSRAHAAAARDVGKAREKASRKAKDVRDAGGRVAKKIEKTREKRPPYMDEHNTE